MSFLTRRNNRNTNDLFSSEMNKLIDSFFGGSTFQEIRSTSELMGDWNPSVDVSETKTEYKVKAELPGLGNEDVELTFQDNTLFLKGEKKIENKEEREDFHYQETSYGSFQRAIPFNAKVDDNKISANFDKGVLTISLGKAEDVVEKTRKISIN